jgi:LytS/YehU family sensor histidine kinase
VAIATPIEVGLHYLLFSFDSTSFGDVFTLKNNSRFFLGSFFIAFSSSIYKIINDWMEHQRERSELQKQNLRSELKFLKTQINPHFFFNTLNSLYALTLKKSDKAPEIVLKLSDMMRYMLYESNERTIALSKEIDYINNYLELEKLRHGNSFQINFELDGSPDGHEIAPLLFIPFLENSFKHGLDHELKSGYVNIQLKITDNTLDLTVKNSKPTGIVNKDGLKKVGGIGLTNVRRRLNILYPSRYSLETKDLNQEFVVQMKLRGTKK